MTNSDKWNLIDKKILICYHFYDKCQTDMQRETNCNIISAKLKVIYHKNYKLTQQI